MNRLNCSGFIHSVKSMLKEKSQIKKR